MITTPLKRYNKLNCKDSRGQHKHSKHWRIKEKWLSIKDRTKEARRNLIRNYRIRKVLFQGIIGYEDTVIPDVEEHCSPVTIYYFLVYADKPRPAWPAKWWTCSMNIYQ
jgi:hypothetical protein